MTISLGHCFRFVEQAEAVGGVSVKRFRGVNFKFYSHKTSTKWIYFSSPSALSLLGLFSKIIQPWRDKKYLFSLLKRVQINLLFIHLGNSTKALWGYWGQEYHRSSGNTTGEYFPEYLGACATAAAARLWAWTPLIFEITQVAELFVSLTVSLQRTWNENIKWSKKDTG